MPLNKKCLAAGLILAGFFVCVQTASAAADICIYTTEPNFSSKCFVVDKGKLVTGSEFDCGIVTDELKLGEAVFSNVAGGFAVSQGDICPEPLVLNKEKKYYSHKFSQGIQKVDAYAEVSIDGLFNLAKALGEKINFNAKLTGSGLAFFELEQYNAEKLLNDYINSQAKNYCCVSYVSKTGDKENYACTKATNSLAYQDYLSEFFNNLTDEKKTTFKAGEFFDFFKANIKKEVFDSFYDCGSNPFLTFYPYACDDKTQPVKRPQVKSNLLDKWLLIDMCYPEGAPPTSTNSSKLNIPDVSSLNKIGTTDPRVFFGRLITTLMGILGSIALVMFIYGGILYMIDLGNSDNATKAKHIVVWTALGLAVIFSSYAILKIVFEAVK